MQDIVSALRGIEFFHNIPDEYLNRVATISRIVEFPGRHDIFREHESAKDVYFIISGRVSLVICAPPFGCRQLMEVTAGELIGWSPLSGPLTVIGYCSNTDSNRGDRRRRPAYSRTLRRRYTIRIRVHAPCGANVGFAAACDTVAIDEDERPFVPPGPNRIRLIPSL